MSPADTLGVPPAPPAPGTLKAVVFDCDGVVLDSRDANVRFYTYVLERFGYPPVEPHQVEYIHMHSAQESLLYLMGSPSKADEAWEFCQQVDFRLFNPYLRLHPGLKEFLEELSRTGYRIALNTNRTVSTPVLLRHFELESYFDLVVTASHVRFPKPHPESMEKILQAFGVAPRETLYIGDSPVDEAVAQASGVYFAAYRNPKLRAHWKIHHFEELRSLFYSEP